MVSNIVSWLVVVLMLVASGALLVGRDWRIQLGILAFQYLGAFWLISRHWPLAMASAKLVAGWMVVAGLGMTRLSLLDSSDEQPLHPLDQIFPLTLIGIVAVATAGAAPRIEAVIPGIGLPVISGSILLIGTGLMQLGISANTLRVILGLFSILIGFEILYSAVESSILVAGLLAVTNLGLGLVGSYLLIAESSSASTSEQEELS